MPRPNYEGERIADALLRNLCPDPEATEGEGTLTLPAGRNELALAIGQLITAGDIRTGTVPVLDKPLDARELARLAAETLAQAREAAIGAHDLAIVAEGYRNLAAVVASNVALQPETDGNN